MTFWWSYVGHFLVSGQHHLQELVPVYLPVRVEVRQPEHFLALLLAERVAESEHGLAKFTLGDASVAVVVKSPGSCKKTISEGPRLV